ncbi:hypothetical protein J4401_01675 [Candidatus Woesearchaeota archaeon]|nr:hypothetical protein [Candidatus Woesearchaeota archaeon]
MDERITPYSDIADSKKQVNKIQANPNPSSDQLIMTVQHLTRSMGSMLELFRTAAEEMKLEEKEEHAVAQQITPLLRKLDEMMEQNKVIAEGMVALADLVKERIPSPGMEMPRPKANSPFDTPPFPKPAMPPIPQQPFFQPPPQMQFQPAAPPPAEPAKKKGLFRR